MHGDDHPRLNLSHDGRRGLGVNGGTAANGNHKYIHIAECLGGFGTELPLAEVAEVRNRYPLGLDAVYRIQAAFLAARGIVETRNAVDADTPHFVFARSGNDERAPADRGHVGVIRVGVGDENHGRLETGRRQAEFLRKRINRDGGIANVKTETGVSVPADNHTRNDAAYALIVAYIARFEKTAAGSILRGEALSATVAGMEKSLAGDANLVFERGGHLMDVLLKQKNGYAAAVKPGDIVDGAVIEKKGSRLYVDLGLRGVGIVYGREYFQAQDIIRRLGPGDPVSAKVVEVENDERYVELSLKEAGREKNWQDMRRLMQSGELITLKVLDANRGGLILEYLGVAGFLPASQLSQEHYPRVEGGDKEKIFEELKKLVGHELEVAIIDVNPEDGKLIFSEKSKEVEALKVRLAAYHVGDVVDGEVAGVVSFGAFVKFGDGLEGLVHISEIGWQLISNPADVLKAGDRVQAKIIAIEGDKVSLSLKALKEDPWVKAEEKYAKGSIVTGVVAKFNPFGAFVKLDPDIQGLAHISEFGTEAKMKEMLTLNEPHEFRVLSMDAKEHRLALGLPARPAPPELQPGEPAGLSGDEPEGGAASPTESAATIEPAIDATPRP